MKKKTYTGIVLAAGKGKRMKSEVQKQFLLLDGKPILFYSLDAFEKCEDIDEVILVTGKESLQFCQTEIVEKFHFNKVKKVVAGGKERYDSVYEGLKAAEGCDYILIHDGARPFLTQEILARVIQGVTEHQACVAGVKSKDTIKLADEEGKVTQTPPRDSVWNIQTPQAFAYSLIRRAHDRIREGSMEGITDDAMVVEALGSEVWLTEGSYENIKITTPDDLTVGESILRSINKNSRM
ncbi:MAG: 2-C-methyl-D-erythritol 4-phosphate cytidylyltransferase [Lachnospiraceae bacterium]|jgi:2-C-methyl-D-erythritol 4-phosphate cytidylyltransferase